MTSDDPERNICKEVRSHPYGTVRRDDLKRGNLLGSPMAAEFKEGHPV